MPKSRPPYPAEFRQQMIELVLAGRNPEELSQEFGCTAQSIRNWVGQAAVDGASRRAAKVGMLTSAEREELTRLRRQVRQLQMERDILAKATAWFAGKRTTSRSLRTREREPGRLSGAHHVSRAGVSASGFLRLA
jgi:transposase